MVKIEGQSVQKGIAIGNIFVWKKKEVSLKATKISNPEEELNVFYEAREKAIAELREMGEKAKGKVSDEDAEIFTVHQMLLQDLDFEDAVKDGILQEHLNASYATYQAGESLAEIFAAMDDNAYMMERASDFRDIAARVVRKLQNIEDKLTLPETPVILVADDLSPTETIGIDTSSVLAFVTAKGSMNSHTAILARSLGITTLVNTGVELLDEYHGKLGIVDGLSGRFFIDPEEDVLYHLQTEKEQYEEEQKALQELIGVETITRSGRKIGLYANIGNVEDAKRALRYDAEGIGLFRSEFLYLNRNDYPSEEEQFESYKQVAEMMEGKEVIIRTLDIGADKQADYFQIPKEENPAMGLRAIRICLTRPEVFKAQLRALYRASAFGKLGIMFPMITSVEEVDEILGIVEEVKKELVEQNIEIGNPDLGVMIETPAAALISDLLAEKVDFFSIGTNDLTQYTLAMDRQNASLVRFLNIHHQALLRLIEMTVRNAHAKNVRVGICGELGADPDLTEYFISIGVDELSVSAPRILSLRKQIREFA
ncbi:MAG: phosphoenolpyruvate--protein phosphotransferase [Lachnospiraceae bacterium]|nr:phosphoenolpyruvate--protein phosphotransferase [Lachnospiraceae bacterium]